jgi:hypothetical protein
MCLERSSSLTAERFRTNHSFVNAAHPLNYFLSVALFVRQSLSSVSQNDVGPIQIALLAVAPAFLTYCELEKRPGRLSRRTLTRRVVALV